MLDQIAKNGTSAQSEQAKKTLLSSAALRAQRSIYTDYPRFAASATAAGKYRIVYSADNKSDLPGRQVRVEGAPPTGDAAVDEAYDGAGATYDLYNDVYTRNSIDGNGLRLDSTVHYQQDYDNAFWNGQQMVYGDGDGDLFNRFTIAIDVIGHELTHGVPSRSQAHLRQSTGRAERIDVRRLRLAGQAAPASTDRGAGRLADRAGAAHRQSQRRGAALDEGARHGLRRPGARQGSAARAHARLRQHAQR
jgi:hypothetical protein